MVDLSYISPWSTSQTDEVYGWCGRLRIFGLLLIPHEPDLLVMAD